jgi:hypothetical protein
MLSTFAFKFNLHRYQVAIKVEDVSAAAEGSGSFDDSADWPQSVTAVTPLELEHEVMSKVMHASGLAGFARIHFFGEQRVFGRRSRVLVMDLLGPSLEDMSWAVSAGG